ncbi:MAG: carboxy terminal-processing peptidase [Candidatus Pseudobacter hemicellulosilyticus]|uniref:Carboxy terminal-processing peptidase n=1 Tax=Candidatus Pseudobacter hemicellulosilyticus TaxID=3121375 RepID=A0AAJ5WQN7_9BACT|nr:MAG: carboxy terminal-processing peptidase [Pseudobacter sp.]
MKSVLTFYRSLLFSGSLLLATGLQGTAQMTKVTDNIDLVFHSTAGMLQQIHYAPRQLDDQFSRKVFNAYLDQLDPGKRFFLQEDLTHFKKFETQLDDEMRGRQVQFYKAVNSSFKGRLKEAEKQVEELLKHPFQFTDPGTYNENTEKLSFCKTAEELTARWKNYLKFQVLAQYEDELEIRSKASSKDSLARTTDAQLEEKARQLVNRIEQRNIESLLKLTTDEEAFNTYINTITNLYDPHSNYFLPVDRREFQEGLSGIYYGIGALLQEQQGKVSINELMIGGPAWKSGQVEKGDILVKVAQQGEKPVDVAGFAMSEIIKLTRGKKGTAVTITFRRNDGTLREVPLTREALQLEDTFVKSAVIDNGQKLGYISFPKFYTKFGDANGRSCAEDMQRELEKLKAEAVEGIIVDIRNNTGGSLGEVINMVGLFIKEGPVVQVKSASGAPYVSQVKSPNVVYDGPLVVLVNEISASASEIFAAAIQDYHRGIVIGSSSTYGKGSVQRSFGVTDARMPDLEDVDLGTVHITLQKYYRITGGATQLKGIVPDIQLPGIYEPYKMQEKYNPTALAWDTIPAVPFVLSGDQGAIGQVIALAGARIAKDTQLTSLRNNLQWLKNRGTVHQLQLLKYRREEKELQSRVARIRKQLVTSDSLAVANVGELGEELLNREQFRIDSNRSWLNSLKKDLFLSEAVWVLHDYIRVRRTDS